MKTLRRKDIAKDIHELLELKGEPAKSGAIKILNIVIGKITDALLRGEKVHIQGFGTFTVRMRKGYFTRAIYFYRDKGTYSEMLWVPEKPYVNFSPTKALRNFVNKPIREQEEEENGRDVS